MNTDQLNYLIQISKNVSMSAAAQELHITPQALSIAIKKLENELGMELLNRSFRGISLTADGKWLVNEATHFLNSISQRQQTRMLNSAQYSGSLNIFLNFSGISNDICGELICNLMDQNPSLDIHLQEITKNEILDRVLTGRIPFGIIFRTTLSGSFIEDIDDALAFEPLFDGEMIVTTAYDHPLAKFNTVSIKKLSQYPLCCYFAGTANQQTANDTKSMLTFPLPCTIENNFSIYKEKILRSLSNGLSVQFSVSPEPVNDIQGTKHLKLREDIDVFFGIIYKKGTTFSDNEIYFLEELKALIQRHQR